MADSTGSPNEGEAMDVTDDNNVNASMGGPATNNNPPSQMIHRQSTTKTFEKTYEKTFWHYVSNNTDNHGVGVRHDSNGTPSLVMDFGAQYVPYDSCRCTMRPQDWLDAWRNASKFRIKQHKVTINDYQPLQESISNNSTNVQSQFVSEPALWIYTDPARYFGLRSIRPIFENQSLYSCNNYLQRPIPNGQADGLLQRCMIDLGTEFLESIDDLNLQDVKDDKFTELNGMLEVSKIIPGQTFEYDSTYESAESRWYPIGNFNTTELKDVPFANKHKVKECPTDTGYIEANYATLVNKNFTDETKMLLLKIEDYFSSQGKINIVGKIKVTYLCTLEFETRPDLGFNALQVASQSQQLREGSDWEKSAVPPKYFNHNVPRSLTMYNVGITYDKDLHALTKNVMTQERPPDRSLKTLSQAISEVMNPKFEQQTPLDSDSKIVTFKPTATANPINITYKRKSTTRLPTPAEIRNKKLKVIDGVITDQTKTPILPTVLRINSEEQLIADTELEDDSKVLHQRQDNAAEQLKTLDPTEDVSNAIWTGDENNED